MAPILRILSSYVSRKVRSFSREWRSIGTSSVLKRLILITDWSGEDLDTKDDFLEVRFEFIIEENVWEI